MSNSNEKKGGAGRVPSRPPAQPNPPSKDGGRKPPRKPVPPPNPPKKSNSN